MRAFWQWIGIELDEVSITEKVLSGLGGSLAILAVFLVGKHVLGLSGAPLIGASAGASAVLLFAVPHGQLSQPWPLLGGHVVSATIGVTCARAIDNRELAAALAIGLAITAMHLLKCIHPPGGANALTPVLAGPTVGALGYGFVWRPVLLNALIVLVMAVAFNAAFPWRRYPASLARRWRTPQGEPTDESLGTGGPTHDELVTALRSLDSFVDVTEDDLMQLIRLLGNHAGRPEPY